MNTPLYQTATFKQSSATEYGTHVYTRGTNPTRDALERLLANLEKGKEALCFTSGMASFSAVAHLLEAGDEIVAGDELYHGAHKLLSEVLPKSGIAVKRVDATQLDRVASAITSQTKLVWVESSTNPYQNICNIRKIADIAHAQGALLMVDNTMLSHVLSQPLQLGADIVMHSATKFISGHSDVLAGVLAVKEESLARRLKFIQVVHGVALAPFDSWLCLKGIKTMTLRIEKQQENAQKMTNRRCKRVFWQKRENENRSELKGIAKREFELQSMKKLADLEKALDVKIMLFDMKTENFAEPSQEQDLKCAAKTKGIERSGDFRASAQLADILSEILLNLTKCRGIFKQPLRMML